MARENASHAPGNEIGRNEGGLRQHQMMGQGKGVMKGENFGVGPLPGTHHLPAMGSHMPHDGVHLADHGRAGPPPIPMGEHHMHATAHSHPGPHHHSQAMHNHAPEGSRPHHVGHMTVKGRGK